MDFNPYTEWLAIPPSQTPPSHYRLLGVRDFESDRERIQRSALDQLARLRVYQAGPHLELTQSLMNEISLARLVLCDPHKKAEYDRMLRKGVDDRRSEPAQGENRRPRIAPVSVEFTGAIADEPSEDFEEIVDFDASPAVIPYRRQWVTGPLRTVLRAAVATIAVLALVVAVVFLSRITMQSPSLAVHDAGASPSALEPVAPVGPAALPSEAAPAAVSRAPTDAAAKDPPVSAPSEGMPGAFVPVRVPTVSAGFQKIWEWDRTGAPRQIAVLENDTVEFGDAGMRLERKGPGRHSIFGPGELGDCGLVVHVRDAPLRPGQQLRIGALDRTGAFVGAKVHGRQHDRTVEFSGPLGEASSSTVALDSEGGFWISVLHRHGQWWVQVRRDKDGEVRDFPRYRMDLKPVVLTIALENRSSEPAGVCVDHLWIEARNAEVLQKYARWPNVVTIPPDRVAASFVGKVALDKVGGVQLDVDFRDDAQLAAWGGEKVGERSAGRIRPGEAVPLGPIACIRAIELHPARPVEHATRMTMAFDDGPIVEIDFGSERATIDGRKIAEFRRSDETIRISLYEVDESRRVKEGTLAFDPTEIPLGEARIAVDRGEIELKSLRVEGEVDFRRLWLEGKGSSGADLAATPKKLDEPEPPPKPEETVPAQTKEAAPPMGRWLVLGPIPLADHEHGAPMKKLAKYFKASERKGEVPVAGQMLREWVWRRADSLEGGPGLYLVALPILWPSDRPEKPILRLEVAKSPGGAYFWFDRSINPICKIAEDRPSVPPDHPVASDEFRISPGQRRCIYGMVYVPANADPVLSAEVLDVNNQAVTEAVVNF